MPVIAIATLDGLDLPVQFSYNIPVPEKRVGLVQTSNAVVRQVAPNLVQSDALIEWTCPMLCMAEWVSAFFDKYNQASDPTFRFVGYWGDEYDVKWHSLDKPQPKGMVFNAAGSWQVITVITYPTA